MTDTADGAGTTTNMTLPSEPTTRPPKEWYQEVRGDDEEWVTVTVYLEDGSSRAYRLPRRTMFEDLAADVTVADVTAVATSDDKVGT